MAKTISFTVYGRPEPKGSMRAFITKGAKPRAVVTSDNAKMKPWAQQVSWTAKGFVDGCIPKALPVIVHLVFYLSKPDSPRNRTHPTVKPDIDKLSRAALDALTGIVFTDDSQVVTLRADKIYGKPERTDFFIRECDCTLTD